jgi:hypothetical protein
MCLTNTASTSRLPPMFANIPDINSKAESLYPITSEKGNNTTGTYYISMHNERESNQTQLDHIYFHSNDDVSSFQGQRGSHRNNNNIKNDSSNEQISPVVADDCITFDLLLQFVEKHPIKV